MRTDFSSRVEGRPFGDYGSPPAADMCERGSDDLRDPGELELCPSCQERRIEHLDLLQDMGWQTSGLDPVTAGTITRHTMIDTLPVEPTYDFILMKHVIEHLPDPLSVLRQARKSLREEGRLYVGVPTIDRLVEHGQKDYCFERAHHITAYTQRSLASLLAVAGFEIERDVPATLPQRMRVIARLAAHPAVVPDPLSDARRELREFAIARHGWPADWTKSIRDYAHEANKQLAAAHEEILLKRAQREQDRAQKDRKNTGKDERRPGAAKSSASPARLDSPSRITRLLSSLGAWWRKEQPKRRGTASGPGERAPRRRKAH